MRSWLYWSCPQGLTAECASVSSLGKGCGPQGAWPGLQLRGIGPKGSCECWLPHALESYSPQGRCTPPVWVYLRGRHRHYHANVCMHAAAYMGVFAKGQGGVKTLQNCPRAVGRSDLRESLANNPIPRPPILGLGNPFFEANLGTFPLIFGNKDQQWPKPGFQPTAQATAQRGSHLASCAPACCHFIVHFDVENPKTQEQALNETMDWSNCPSSVLNSKPSPKQARRHPWTKSPQGGSRCRPALDHVTSHVPFGTFSVAYVGKPL